MFTKIKAVFKWNNWKRQLVVVFSFILAILFVGLSFGLYSKKTSPTTQYQSGIQVVVKPSNLDYSSIDDQVYLNQIYYNLSSRLEQEYPSKNIKITKEDNGTFDIKVTNIDNEIEKNNFINYLVEKKQLTLTSLSYRYGETPFFTGDTNMLFTGAEADVNSTSYKLLFQKNGSGYTSQDVYNSGLPNVKYIIIWKNFDILKEIVNQQSESDNISNQQYGGFYYKYLFQNGEAPTKLPNDSSSSSNTKNYFFKDELIHTNEITGEIKKYHPTDFLVSINELSEYNNKPTLDIKKDFGVINWKPNPSEIKSEFSSVRYWLNPYNFNNYVVSNILPENASHSYPVFIIAMVVFFAIIAIFVVISYGYLGIIAIFLLAIIVFLSLLMITALIGDYDTTSVLAIVASSLISLEFIVLFFEKIKKEIKKGNSISKSVKNSIKVTSRNDYVKAFLLSVSLAIVYVVLSTIYATFSAIVLSTIVFIPFVIIFVLRFLSKVFVDIKRFENNKRTIGFWNQKRVNLTLNSENESNEPTLLEQIEEEKKDNKEIKSSQWFLTFSKLNKNGLLISLLTIGYLVLGGLTIFLISMFRTGNGFTLSANDQQKTVLRISLDDSNLNQKSAIKSKLLLDLKDAKKINIVEKPNIIEVYLNKDYSEAKLNTLSLDLIKTYNVKVIVSNLISSNTYLIMKYTLFGILVAIVAMCVFVLLWMNWTKALSFLLIAIVYVVNVMMMLMFGFLTMTPIVSSILIVTFGLFILTTLTSLIRYNQKLKSKRIQEMDSKTITNTIDLVTFKNMKSTLIFNGICLISFIVFAIFYGSLPLIAMLFIGCFVITNLIFNVFLLPKFIIKLEILRARGIRKRVINQYWDTEKVHEQVFSGINNIK